MKFSIKLLLTILLPISAWSQNNSLSIKQIMQGEKFVGTSPSNVYWGEHSEYLYFDWNPEQNIGDSLYRISTADLVPKKVDWEIRKSLPNSSGNYNQNRNQKVYTKNGDVFIYDLASRQQRQITNTLAWESSPSFSYDGTKILFKKSNNLFSWEIATGLTSQLTDFKKGSKKNDTEPTEQDAWLKKEQLELIQIVKERKEANDEQKSINESHKPIRPKTIYINSSDVDNIQLSGDGNYIIYSLYSSSKSKNTIVPNYVTESSYTTNINARTNVGSPRYEYDLGIYDIKNDTSYVVDPSNLPGLDTMPKYLKEERKRKVYLHTPQFSPDGSKIAVVVRSRDNKDRWITSLDLSTGMLKSLDHQHDEAWIAGPGISWSQWDEGVGWLPDNQHIWFQSEETGYSHLYICDVVKGKKKGLTKGDYEIYNPTISGDNQYWYFNANKTHPGEQHLYKMPLMGGNMEQLTTVVGKHEAILSPDGANIAILHSKANQPTELYLMDATSITSVKQVTSSTREAFNSYQWRIPEFITFKAKDGVDVHARLYKTKEGSSKGPAIIFVHGAGYLQNAHKWWSEYYREYMFHNFLVDNGYTVLDIDYRGSAGYGRDWRTGIYQNMGGTDLSDHIDGAQYLINEHQIDSKRIGIYGGSYGGFITLMAMFTEPDVFVAGAALRSVTDWSHYNHGYTSNILNIPVDDPEAFKKSSPIYYANGLKGALLICHGMIDTNVHFQDVVRLSQRLIELEKENWELAVYPLEGHGFKEPSSWTDEYSRIFKLFENNLK